MKPQVTPTVSVPEATAAGVCEPRFVVAAPSDSERAPAPAAWRVDADAWRVIMHVTCRYQAACPLSDLPMLPRVTSFSQAAHGARTSAAACTRVTLARAHVAQNVALTKCGTRPSEHDLRCLHVGMAVLI